MRVALPAAIVLVILVACAPGLAGVINGTFTSDSLRADGTRLPDGWMATLTPEDDLALGIQDIVTTHATSTAVLKCGAANTYSWIDEAWEVDQDDYSSVEVMQINIIASAGDSELSFKGAAFYEGADIYAGDGRFQPAVVVSAVYARNDMSLGSPLLVIGDSDWVERTIPLPDLNAAFPVQIKVFLTSELDSEETHVAGVDAKSVIVTGYFDDFALVPEPATLCLLAMGALVFRRKR